MSKSDSNSTTRDLQALRREGGEELKALRHAKGLSQRDLAKALRVIELSFISQIETGRRPLPSDKYMVYAEALELDAKDFIKRLMRFYDPITYEILFEDREIATLGGVG